MEPNILTKEEIKQEFNRVYEAYSVMKNEIEELRLSVNEQIKHLAKKMEVKNSVLNKALSYKFKRASKGEDDIADIQELLSKVDNKD